MNQRVESLMQAGPALEHALRVIFEQDTWRYYQDLKAKGWSDPAEGDCGLPSSLFWREPSGKYGVHQIEAAWNGWRMCFEYFKPWLALHDKSLPQPVTSVLDTRV